MPLFWLSLAFLSGIVCAAALSPANTVWLAIFLAAIFWGILQWKIPNISQRLFTLLQRNLAAIHIPLFFSLPLPIAILGLAFAIGGYRYATAQSLAKDPRNIASYANRGEVVLQGLIIQPPDYRDTFTAIIVKVENLRFKGTSSDQENKSLPPKYYGYILARLEAHAPFHYGDRILLEGTLEIPPESQEFSYRAYLERQNIFAYLPKAKAKLISPNQGNWLYAGIFKLQAHAQNILKHIFPEPQAALLSGILLGIESGIPQNLQDAFINSGTAHIIAISGFNITLLAGLLMAFFGRLLGRWRGAILSVLLISLYTILVGANASVVRAALMGALTLFAAQIGRRQSGINSLAFLAAIMTAFQPFILWDVSFQLSFAATLGLVLYATPLTEKWIQFLERFFAPATAKNIGSLSSEWLLFTLAAQITTLPVILYHFQRLSIISLLANPLILPLQPMLMVLSGLALLGGFVFLPLGQVLAYLAYPFVTYTIRMVEWSGNLPYSSILLNPIPLIWILLFYVFLFVLTFAWQPLHSIVQKVQPIFALCGFFIIATLIWQMASRKPDGLLHLILLDVNQPTRSGEAILIQTPQGRYVLINGGPSAPNLLSAMDAWMPISWREVDWLVIAGVYDNQIRALPELIERGRVKNAWWAIPDPNSASTISLQAALKSQQIPIIFAQLNQILDLGDGAQLRIIALNKSGAVLLLEWGQFRAFLPLGFDTATRDEIAQSANFTPVTAWLLANRGADWLNAPALLSLLQPQLILINASQGEWGGLPDTTAPYLLQGQNILRTDQNGWIHIQTNGARMWV
ncbi:MAG: ComEC/Rec2 family competence protein, partial [Anaerolineales bacterium]